MGSCLVTLPADIDFITPLPDEFGSETLLALYITHSNGGAEGVAIGTGGRVTYRLAVAINRFAAPKHGTRIVQDKCYQHAFQSGLFLLEQSVLAEERHVFFP